MLLLHHALLPRRRLAGAGVLVLVEAGHSATLPLNPAEDGGSEGSCTLNPPADNGTLRSIELRIRKW